MAALLGDDGIGMSMKTSAVFLDRDGTLIEDRGYLRTREQIEWIPDAMDALSDLRPFFRFFLVTNQGAVGMGQVTMEEVQQVNAALCQDLLHAGITIDEIYVCPHRREDNCECIKPNPYFLKLAAEKHGVDLSKSYVIGDHPHDVELARRAGACGIYVLTGHGRRHLHELQTGTLIADDLRQASAWILSQLPWKEEAGGRRQL